MEIWHIKKFHLQQYDFQNHLCCVKEARCKQAYFMSLRLINFQNKLNQSIVMVT